MMNLKYNMNITYRIFGRSVKGYEDEYNKGFFTAANTYGYSHIYLLHLYYGEGEE